MIQTITFIDRLTLSEMSYQKIVDGSIVAMIKPLTWTSFQLVKKVRNITRTKVGHAGTLDPLASGLMIIGINKGTKKLSHYLGMDKCYQAEITLGAVTESYDLEKTPKDYKPYEHLTHEEIRQAIIKFRGDTKQYPPAFSAIKQSGKRLYELSRKGIKVTLPERSITIHNINMESVQLPKVSISVHCSSGTYIRSLAHDIGTTLGCGAYLSKLTRTHIGKINIEDALTCEELTQLKS